MAKQDEFIKTQVRLPRDLHARIQLAAEQSGRSMNAEIVHQLETYSDGARVLDLRVHADGTFTLRELKKLLKDVQPQLAIRPEDTLSVTVQLNDGTELL